MAALTTGALGTGLALIGGSLAAIAALGGLARGLGLGADERLRDERTARELAEATDCSFVPALVSLDRAGLGALLADDAGRIMLVRRHGARFVGRLLAGHDGIRLERTFLRFALPEPGFVPITLDLGAEAQLWAARLRGLGRTGCAA